MGYPSLVRYAAAAALLTSGQANSAPAIVIPDTGNDILSLCKTNNNIEWGLCLGFILGVRDGLRVATVVSKSPRLFCIPTGVTNGQLRDIVVARLEATPAIRHLPAAAHIFTAFRDEFPCLENNSGK